MSAATTTTGNKTIFTLLPYQSEAEEQIFKGFTEGIPKMLIAEAGTGKTYALASAIRRAQDARMFKSSKGMVNVLFLSTKSAKTQSHRVLSEAGVQGIHVENYATLRSSLGELFIDWYKEFSYGTLAEKPVWREEDKPDIIVCDECQMLKNPATQQAHIIKAAAKADIPLIFASATPFVTIAEAKILCIGLKVCTEETWKHFASSFAVAGKRIDEISPQGVKNLINYLEKNDRIVRFKNVKWKHRSINHCVLIDFPTAARRKEYERAYDDYLEECRKNDKGTPEGIRAVWVANQKFRVKSENLRDDVLAQYGFDTWVKHDRQILLGSNFITTLRGIWEHLTKLGVSPKEISYIVGGQNEKERQKQIDLFQAGKTQFCLLTLKSGGAGISLHHDRQKTKPRHCILPPTWSAIELVQVLGRGHRINSISTTHQDIIWYKNTIEEQVAEKVASRFSCLGEVVGRKESWVNIFNQISEEDASKLTEKITDEQTDRDGESGEELIFSAEALENSSVE